MHPASALIISGSSDLIAGYIIKTNLSKETQAVLQKNTEELGVDKVKKQISLFFTTPIDKINKL